MSFSRKLKLAYAQVKKEEFRKVMKSFYKLAY